MSASEIKKILNDPVALKALAKRIFDNIDARNSGFIDESELKQAEIQVRKELGLPPPSESEIRKAMEQIDTTGNEKIDLKQFEQYLNHILKMEDLNQKEKEEQLEPLLAGDATLAGEKADITKAEIHGEAQLVRKLEGFKKDDYDPETICPDCKLTTAAPFFPLCTDIPELKELGPGIPLFYW